MSRVVRSMSAPMSARQGDCSDCDALQLPANARNSLPFQRSDLICGVVYCEQRRRTKGAYGCRCSVEQTSLKGGHNDRARSARARNSPVAPNHQSRCLLFGLQVHAPLGQGQIAEANAIRTATWNGLLEQLSGDSSLDTAEPRGPRAQAKAYSRSEAHEGRIAINSISPARPH
jgi:hypothetical protein